MVCTVLKKAVVNSRYMNIYRLHCPKSLQSSSSSNWSRDFPLLMEVNSILPFNKGRRLDFTLCQMNSQGGAIN